MTGSNDSDRQSRRWLTRQMYAATIVGLAVFFVGLIIWPAPEAKYRTTARIAVALEGMPSWNDDSFIAHVERIEEEVLDDHVLNGIIDSLPATIQASYPLTSSYVRRVVKVEAIVDDESGAADSGTRTRIELSISGEGNDLDRFLLTAITEEVALRSQREFVELPDASVEGLPELVQEARRLEDQYTRVTESMSILANEQKQRLAEQLNRLQADINRRQQTASASSAGADFAHEDGIAEYENPQWLLLAEEKKQLVNLSVDMQQQNKWTSSHPEIQRLHKEAELVQRRLDVTPRFVTAAQLRQDQSAKTVSVGFGEVVDNHYYEQRRRQAELEKNRVPATLVSDVSSRQSVQQLMEFQRQFGQAMESIQSASEQQTPELEPLLHRLDMAIRNRESATLATVQVAQHPTKRQVVKPQGDDWRFMVLLALSAAAATTFVWRFGQGLGSGIGSVSEIERNLGLPVVGVLGNQDLADRNSPRRLSRVAAIWLRISEGIVLAIVALVVLTILLQSRMSSDFLQNPLMALSEILRRLFVG